MAKCLDDGATFVSYGSMSKQPLSIPSGLLIFRDLRFRGFWLTGGYAKVRPPGVWGVGGWVLWGAPHPGACVCGGPEGGMGQGAHPGVWGGGTCQGVHPRV